MASVDILEVGKKKPAGSVELDPVIFEAPVRPHLFHAEVRRQLAARRAGTHATKNRAGVSGGGVKPWRQKGTGRARQGSIRSPQWAGGGVVFGPVPRQYDHKLTKKTRRAALRGALSLRMKEGAVTVAQGLALDAFKTKRVVEMLDGFGLAEKSVLIVIGEGERAPRGLRPQPAARERDPRRGAQRLRRAAPRAAADRPRRAGRAGRPPRRREGGRVRAHDVILRPVTTEKSTLARELSNVVTLAVDPRAGKHDIKSAVEQLFKVKVLDVRTIRMPRKTRRVGKFLGAKREWKKAIVQLAEGQTIEFFEGV